MEFTKWGEWTECSRTCGGGKRARERACIIPDGQDLVKCTGELRQVRDCNNDPCPGDFTACDDELLPRTSVYYILNPFSLICFLTLLHRPHPSPPDTGNYLLSLVNCKWEWEPFGQCSKPCGGGKRSRFPIIRQPAEHGGRPCPPFVENRQPETEDCNTNPCPSMYHIVQ